MLSGAALHERGDLDEAIAAFEKAIDLDSKYAFALITSDNLDLRLLSQQNPTSHQT